VARSPYASMILTTMLWGSTAMAADLTSPVAEAVDYTKSSTWLCRPNHNRACATNLDATIIAVDGTERVERWHADPHPPIDCFYVYPTVSADKQSNSDLSPADDEEIAMTRQQVARFASVCRLFVPLYRQVTVTVMRGEAPPGDRELAYRDVGAAWNEYLKHSNGGRGVVLIGHSQGAYLLRRLIREEIDGKPLQRLIISALLIGGDVQVAEGREVGGDFRNIPLCRAGNQIGCVIAYSTFRDTDPPDGRTYFGKSERQGLATACTNPAALGGGSAALDAYLPSDFNSPPYHTQPNQTAQPPWVKDGKPVRTPYVKVPGLLWGECRQNQYASYLGIGIHSGPDSLRVGDIKGDIVFGDITRGQFGLHLIDMLLPLGNLLAVVRQQSAVYVLKRLTERKL
jgi:hypothetical protein